MPHTATYPGSITRWFADAPQIDDSFGQEYHMSIRIVAGGLSFFLRHESGNLSLSKGGRVSLDASLPLSEALKQAFFAHSILSQPYLSTTIYLSSPSLYALVPVDLAGGISSREWLSSFVDDVSEYQYLSFDLPDLRMRVEYAVDRAAYEFCERSFSLPRYRPSIGGLLQISSVYSRCHSPRTMVASLDGGLGLLDLVLCQEGEVLLANRYVASSSIDVLYYVTALWRQFSFDPLSDHLLFFAPLDQQEELSGLLSPSILQLHMNEYPSLLVSREASLEALEVLPPEIILSELCE